MNFSSTAAISLKTVSLGLRVFLFFVVLFSFVFIWGFAQIPSDKKMKGCFKTRMYEVDLCPQSPQYVRLHQVSLYLQKSVVLTEDSSFWTHNGFDLQEMQNSFKKNLEAGKFARGGSTISQQLAKNLFLTRDKTLSRKALEAIITVRMESVLTKREILERYFNVVQFGKDIFGVKQAAKFYFKKLPEDLNLVESAFLTFLLPNPEVYSKSFFKKSLTPFAEKRIRQIMDRLYQYDRISEAEYLNGLAQVDYFLTGQEPPAIDPAIEDIQEEDVEELD